MADNNASLHIDIRATDNVTKAVKSAQSSLIRFVGAISAAVASINAVSFPIRSAADFERALADVAKTTNFTEQEITSLSGALIDMSRKMSLSAVGLANISATAGQLGLGGKGVKAIEQFTESVARATTTFGLGEQVVSQYAAQILQVFNVPTGKVENLFSEINELSNNSVASARYLLDVMRRVGSVAGLTAEDVGALAASAADFGVTAEVAGTTLVKFFSNMEISAGKFSKVMNISTNEWVSAVNTDALGAFKALSVELAKLDSASQSVAIKDLFGSGRIFSLAKKFVNDASNEFEILNKNTENAEEGFKSGTSSIIEYEKVMGSLNEQLKVLKNSFFALAIESGQNLIPQLKAVVEEMQTFLESNKAADVFDSLVQSIGELIYGFQSLIESAAEFTAIWVNLLPIINIFIGFQIGKLFFGLASSIAASAIRLGVLTSSWSAATAAIKGYISQSQIATALSAASGSAVGAAGLNTTGAGATLARQLAAQKESIALAKAKSTILKENLVLEQKAIAAINLKISQEKLFGHQSASRFLEASANIAALEREAIARRANIVTINDKIVVTEASIAQSTAEIATINATSAALNRQSAARTGSNAANAAAGRTTDRLNRAATAAQAAAGALGFFGRAAKAVFGVLTKFVLSPLGIFIFTLSIFSKQIAEFFGITLNTAEKANDAVAIRSQKRMKEHAEKLVAIYKEEVKRSLEGSDNERLNDYFLSEGLSGAQDVFDTKGPKEYAKYIDEVSLGLERNISALQGAEIQIGKYDDKLYESGVRLKAAEESAERARVEYEDLQKEINNLDKRIKRGGLNAKALEVKKKEAEIAAKETAALYESASKEVDTLIALQGKYVDAIEKETSNRTILAARVKQRSEILNEAMTQEVADYRDATIEWRAAITEYTEIQESLKEQQSDLDNITGRFSQAQRNVLKKEIQESETLQRNLELTIRDAAAFRKSVENSRALTDQDRQFISSINKSSDDALIESRNAVLDIERRTSEEVKKIALENYTNTQIQIHANKELESSFAQISEGLRGAIDTAKSVFDNLSSTINAARRSNQLFFEELESRRAKQIEDRGIAKALEKENALRRQGLELEESYYERLIKARTDRGDTAGADRAREDLAAVKAAFDKETERNALAAKYTDLVKRQNELLLKSENIRSEISELSSFDPNAFADELKKNKELTDEQVQQKVLQEQQRLLNERAYDTDLLKKYEDGLRDVATAVTDIGEDIDPDDTILVGSLTLDDAAIDQVITNNRAGVGRIVESLQEGIKGSYDFAVEAEGGLVTQTDVLSSRTKQLNERLTELEKFLPELETGLTSATKVIATGISTMVKSLGDDADYASMSGALSDIAEGAERVSKVDFSLLDSQIASLRTQIEGLASEDITFSPENIVIDIDSEVEAYNNGTPATVNLLSNIEFDEGTTQDNINKMKDLTLNVALVGKLDPNDIESNAAGGYIRGPGTTTSDSILARLSDKEYVIRAAAVQHYGVNRFNELNAMRLPKFAQGGQVNSESSAVAARDIVNLNLTLGGGTFPLVGDRDVVRRLTNALGTLNRGTR